MKKEKKKIYLIIFSALIGILAVIVLFFSFGKKSFQPEEKIFKEKESLNFEKENNENMGNEKEIKLPGQYLDAKISINQKTFSTQIPLTEETSYKGLGGRSDLDENQGMLFVFKNKAKHYFVMRGMNFDLDFIFIDDDKIVDIQKNIPKDFEGDIVGKEDYNQVLEVKAGTVDKEGFSIGDKAAISYR